LGKYIKNEIYERDVVKAWDWMTDCEKECCLVAFRVDDNKR